MISLKEFIKEESFNAAWKESTISMIFTTSSANIPITPKVINIVSDSNKSYAIHILPTHRMNDLLKIQNKKNTVSVATRGSTAFFRVGVQSGGGVVAVLKGKIGIGDSNDIGSSPDASGIRWIHSDILAYTSRYGDSIQKMIIVYTQAKLKFLRMFLDECLGYMKSIDSPLYHQVKENNNVIHQTIDDLIFDDMGKEINPLFTTKKIIEKYIKIYIRISEKIVIKHKDALRRMINIETENLDFGSDYNELLMAYFTIEYVYIDSIVNSERDINKLTSTLRERDIPFETFAFKARENHFKKSLSQWIGKNK